MIDRVIPVADLNGIPNHAIKCIEKHAEYLPQLNAVRIAADGAYFMNHSDDPNLDDQGDEMFALRDIQAGEELHSDYRQTLVLAFDPDTKSRHLRFQLSLQ